MVSCPTCKRRMPKPRKRKAQLSPLETLCRGLYVFAAFAIEEWPGREGVHKVRFSPRNGDREMRPAVMTAGTTTEEWEGVQV